jgi:hypothetical protein
MQTFSMYVGCLNSLTAWVSSPVASSRLECDLRHDKYNIRNNSYFHKGIYEGIARFKGRATCLHCKKLKQIETLFWN